MITLPPCVVEVKPAALSTIPAIAPTAAELLIGDHLAFLADGGDPNGYRPGWREAEPTAEDLAEDLGFRLGFDGASAELVGPASPAEREAFDRGLLDGDHALWTTDPDYAAHLIEMANKHYAADDLTAIAFWHEAELSECGSVWR